MAGPQPTGEEISYDLSAVGSSNVSGTVRFEELDDMSIRITITLSGTSAGGDHPAHIHANSAAEGGGIVLDLENVDGSTGMSQTIVTELNDGTDLSFESLQEFDGYINVHNSSSDLGTLLAQGDIGSNELTGDSQEYVLSEVGDSGISGTATFSKRVSGETLVVINLTGDPEDSNHPTHIHTGSAQNPGGIAIDLNNVRNGFSRTNVAEFNNGTAITYEELISYAGYINVHKAQGDLGTIVTQGNIGSSVGSTGGVSYDVTNTGMSAYSFSGGSLSSASNPNISLKRGNTYVFNVNAPGHPFWINSTQGTGTGNSYNNGVTNNGAESGTVTFVVPNDAPDKLFYNCEFHASMTGELSITD